MNPRLHRRSVLNPASRRRGLLGGLGLALVLALATPASPQDMVRLSVKHILNKDGVRSSGIYLFDLAVIETVWEMNKALADMGIRWRFDLVEQVELSGASEHYTFEDSDENRRAFELEARDEDPTRFHWRDDAINIFVVNDITGFAGGFASFPGQDGSHRDIILIQSQFDGEIASLAGGWLHEIGHYLSLEHTFTCPDKDCNERTCVGTGAYHRDWEVKCPDVCPDDNNIMSYNDTKGAFKITGTFTQCQIDNMSFELYDPRGERGNVIYPCATACAAKAADCKQACEGVRSACMSSCDAAHDVCHGGCAFVGDACRGVCEATGDTCRAGCTAAVATCVAGCDVVCAFDDDAPACVACRRECARLRADCESPCDEAEASDAGLPEIAYTWSLPEAQARCAGYGRRAAELRRPSGGAPPCPCSGFSRRLSSRRKLPLHGRCRLLGARVDVPRAGLRLPDPEREDHPRDRPADALLAALWLRSRLPAENRIRRPKGARRAPHLHGPLRSHAPRAPPGQGLGADRLRRCPAPPTRSPLPPRSR